MRNPLAPLVALALTVSAFALGAAPASAADAELEGDLRVTAIGTVQFSVPIPDGVRAVDLRLPELRCPVGVPLVEDGRFGAVPERLIAIPSGVELSGSALRAVRASWAPFEQDGDRRTVGLEAGSTVDLEDLVPAEGAAVFTLHCTDEPDRSIDVARLGSVPEPPPLRIGVQVEERLTPKPGVWISDVRDLPHGLELDRAGVLGGRILPTAAGSRVVTVVLTDGFVSVARPITLRIGGEIVLRLTQTWQVTTWKGLELGEFLCPPEYPWTTSEKFHDDGEMSPQRVPRGVQLISEGLVGATTVPVFVGGFGRGMTNVRVWNRLPFGIPSALHFRLFCTNDSNAAGRG